MGNLNEIFDTFPDYDVFDEKNSEIKPKNKRTLNKKSNNFDYIQYHEKNNKKEKKSPAVKEDKPEHSTEYGDGFGIYQVYEERVKNAGSIFFFPLTILWLEILLRLGCGQTLFTLNMVFVTLFSLSVSGIFTVVCTFFNEKFNRFIVTLLTLLLTVLYCVQMVHFNIADCFWLVSGSPVSVDNLADFNNIMNAMSEKVFFLLGNFVPFVFFLFLGKYIFPFRKIRIPAKICLLLIVILLHFSALTILTITKNTESPDSYYSVYHYDTNSTVVQEKFGLYTMEVKDFF